MVSDIVIHPGVCYELSTIIETEAEYQAAIKGVGIDYAQMDIGLDVAVEGMGDVNSKVTEQIEFSPNIESVSGVSKDNSGTFNDLEINSVIKLNEDETQEGYKYYKDGNYWSKYDPILSSQYSSIYPQFEELSSVFEEIAALMYRWDPDAIGEQIRLTLSDYTYNEIKQTYCFSDSGSYGGSVTYSTDVQLKFIDKKLVKFSILQILNASAVGMKMVYDFNGSASYFEFIPEIPTVEEIPEEHAVNEEEFYDALYMKGEDHLQAVMTDNDDGLDERFEYIMTDDAMSVHISTDDDYEQHEYYRTITEDEEGNRTYYYKDDDGDWDYYDPSDYMPYCFDFIEISEFVSSMYGEDRGYKNLIYNYSNNTYGFDYIDNDISLLGCLFAEFKFEEKRIAEFDMELYGRPRVHCVLGYNPEIEPDIPVPFIAK